MARNDDDLFERLEKLREGIAPAGPPASARTPVAVEDGPAPAPSVWGQPLAATGSPLVSSWASLPDDLGEEPAPRPALVSEAAVVVVEVLEPAVPVLPLRAEGADAGGRPDAPPAAPFPSPTAARRERLRTSVLLGAGIAAVVAVVGTLVLLVGRTGDAPAAPRSTPSTTVRPRMLAGGGIVLSDGTKVLPSNVVARTTGEYVWPDGTTVHADGRVTLADGSEARSTSVDAATGAWKGEDGQVHQPPDGPPKLR